jgi:Ca-activated chloride channel family protein
VSTPRRLFLGSLLGAAALPLRGQAPPRPRATPRPPVFEVEIDVINLTVSVTDAAGRYTTGLGRDDFAVYEDGVRQELSLFTADRLPISLCVMIDCSASMDQKLRAAQQAAKRFIGTLQPGDTAQVVQFNDRRTVLQDYTGDREALEQAIGRLEAWGSTSLYNAVYVSLKELGRQRDRELRRRAVVLLSDGEDTTSLVNDEQVIDLAKRTEVAIYSISLRERGFENRGQSFSQAAYVLSTLARDTGGQVHFPTGISELDTVYDRIAEELRSQYSLGYVSTNKRRDGKWRRIVVRVPSRDDVVLRAKLGYFGPA